MRDSNRRFILRRRPTGRITADTFELVEQPIPEIGAGEALVRTHWLSLDPTNRMWINDVPTYLPPVAIGEVMRALGLGQVVASKHDAYREGQLVTGLVGWQEWTVASDAAPLLPVPDVPGVSPSAHLGVLGMPGLTAWVGMNDIGRPQPGETVVVSAAAGAVGSVAGQLAKLGGARVVGIAGGREKCAGDGAARIRRRRRSQSAELARATGRRHPRRHRRRLRFAAVALMKASAARVTPCPPVIAAAAGAERARRPTPGAPFTAANY